MEANATNIQSDTIMPFFKSKPNIATGEKARLEFELQKLSEFAGSARFSLPVISLSQWQNMINQPLTDTLKAIGEHLKHPTGAMRIVVQPEDLASCGGGG